MASTGNTFVRAQSDNLPRVDLYMMMQYIASSDCYNAAEIKGVKAMNSMRKDYINSAIGYVQLQRQGNTCVVKGQICPEHKVNKKNYFVWMEVDEKEEEVLHVTCQDCPASAGGCKHALAFLMWVHHKSTQPAPTDVECYWKKPKLSGIGKDIKFIRTSDFGPSTSFNVPGGSTFLQQFLDESKKENRNPNCQLLKYYAEPDELGKLSMHQIIISFVKQQQATDFFLYAAKVMENSLCEEAEKATRDQSKNDLWHELRYGRITASKLYTAAHCKKGDGAFVEQVIGASKLRATDAMKRGQILEADVLEELQKKLSMNFEKVGLLLTGEHPELGASPDALSADDVVEIKCLLSDKSYKNYVLKNNKISARHKAQLQFQMLIFKKTKGIFCVADPNFESNKKIVVIYENVDELYMKDILFKAKKFWREHILPHLINAVK